MTMEKQKENPKFSFLFGGDFYGYYKYKLALEQQQREWDLRLGEGRLGAPSFPRPRALGLGPPGTLLSLLVWPCSAESGSQPLPALRVPAAWLSAAHGSPRLWVWRRAGGAVGAGSAVRRSSAPGEPEPPACPGAVALEVQPGVADSSLWHHPAVILR